MKSNIDHSSDKEFSIGVPVSANLVSADIFLIAFAFCVLLFFMYCASSAIMYLNLKSYFLYSSISLFNNSYEVITIS